MRNVPAFLTIQESAVERRTQVLMDTLASYQPLLGVWVIDIALGLGWTYKMPGHNPSRFFCSPEFKVTTGMRGLNLEFFNPLVEGVQEDDEDDDEEALVELGFVRRRGPGMSRKLDARYKRASGGAPRDATVDELERRLLAHRAMLVKRGIAASLPLFQNVNRVAALLLLDDPEKAILTFAAALGAFPSLNELLLSARLAVSDEQLFNVLHLVTGHEPQALRRALRSDSVLLTSGLIDFDHDPEPLPTKLSLMRDLRPVMLDALSSDDELCRRVLCLSSPGSLTLDDFPHVQKDTELLQAYLKGAAGRQASSVNILLYGPPGTGKTEYAKALVASLGWSLYEIDYADSQGDPIPPQARLKSMAFSQRALKHRGSAALLFDELEDVLPGGGGGFSLMELVRGRAAGVQAKAWINRMLEENLVPTVWITNDARIDDAYLRRFDYSLKLSIPPQPVRRRILTRLLGDQVRDGRALDSLAALEDLLPAQVERAARVVSFAGLDSEEGRWEGFARTLAHSRSLLGQPRAALQLADTVPYRLDCLNADTDLASLTQGMVQRRRGSMCLYGPPGTGKTAYGRHLADQLGCGLLVRRASDLISKWVGESERNIAGAFAQAEREGAVLLIDEVDSFLGDRRGARAQWEVTLVNEMLTQMESFQGVFVASTNLMDSLDEASLRRFDLKVHFGYLTPEAARHLLIDYCRLLGVPAADRADLRALDALGTLTPGDFATVARRHQFHAVATAGQFVAALCAETAHKKGGVQRPMGFV